MKNNSFITLEYLEKHYNFGLIKEFENNVKTIIDKPLVSVILITYNHKDFIKESIEGILSQVTDFEFEILIGDDGSTDGTREICIEYAMKYPNNIRLILHSQENVISVKGKKSGIFQIVYNHLMSRGKYVAICSGDDVWTDTKKINEQVKILETNKNIGLVYIPFILSKSDNTKVFNEFSISKASTAIYINIKDKMPKRFLKVINEDDFTRFIILLTHRHFCYTNSSPILINEPNNSIMRSKTNFNRGVHMLNFGKQILLSYLFSKYFRKAIKLFLIRIKVIISNKKYKNFRFKIFYHVFSNN
jgi:glycosyltransferase involved in cell wall biosynthesis